MNSNAMKRGLRRPARLLATLAVCSIALASCGSSPKPSGSPSVVTQAVKFAQCMRSNGMTNYADPSSNGRPQSIDPNSAAFLTAYEACRKYAPNGHGGPPAPSVAQLRFALAFAQCMRAHGFSRFPDPLGTAPDPSQHEFTLGTGEYFPATSAIDLQSAAFRQAAKACGVQL